MPDDALHEYNAAVVERMADEIVAAHRLAQSRSDRLITRLRHAANVIRNHRAQLERFEELATVAVRIQNTHYAADDMQALVYDLAELAPKPTDG